MVKTFLLLYYASNDSHLLPSWISGVFLDKASF
jgi:hypothetical protein